MTALEVAVIGAGAAGLVTARELGREGHAVTVFEQNSNVGGVWTYSDAVEEDSLGFDPDRERIHSSLYASVRTNLPREIMSFTDWPFIAEAMQGRSVDSRRFCRHEEVQQYLELFAEEFRILEKIKFHSRVVSVLPVLRSEAGKNGADLLPTLKWAVKSIPSRRAPSKEVSSLEFDAVVCCVGTYFQPNVPDIPGLKAFPGRQLHCHNFRHSSPFTGETVLIVGASFSGDEIARLIADRAKTVYHTARTWAAQELKQPRKNLHRLSWLVQLTQEGVAVFEAGEQLRVDSIVYCTGYKYSFPFLEGSGLISTDDGHVHPVYKHIFVPSAPSLCFVGLLWKSLRFPQFELQAKLVARVLAGRVSLPSAAAMEADIAGFYELLKANGVPMRYVHNQSEAMPLNQWEYNDSLAEMCGPDVPKLPHWRRQLHNVQSVSIFGKPETFRDVWTEEEEASFAAARQACLEMLAEYNSRVKTEVYDCERTNSCKLEGAVSRT